MAFIAYLLIFGAAAGLYFLRRRTSANLAVGRKADVRKDEPALNERHAARRRIIGEAARLHELEDAIMRFGEGSDPGISTDEAGRKRLEAERLRKRLEDECFRLGLPIAIVRRGRARSATEFATRQHDRTAG